MLSVQMRIGVILGLVAGLALPWSASPASADDLPEPPSECPPGATGHTEHAGVWCVPSTCATDADCQRYQNAWGQQASPLVCRERSLCVVEERYALGGNIPDPPPMRTRRVARGPCVGGGCPGGGTCEAARRCVPAETPRAPTSETPASTPSGSRAPASPDSERSWGCSASASGRVSGHQGFFEVAMLAMLLAWILRRRSLRSDPEQ